MSRPGPAGGVRDNTGSGGPCARLVEPGDHATPSPSGVTPHPVLWRVELDIELPTANAALRTHWTKRKRLRDDLMLLIRSRSMYLPPVPICPAHVTITQYRRRLVDPDALGMTVKTLLDILTMPIGRKTYGLCVIRDDRASVLTLDLRQERAPRGTTPRVVVEVAHRDGG